MERGMTAMTFDGLSGEEVGLYCVRLARGACFLRLRSLAVDLIEIDEEGRETTLRLLACVFSL